MDSMSAQELFGIPAEWSDPLAYLDDATSGQGELLYSVAADVLGALDSAQEYQTERLKSAKAMIFRELTKRSRADTRAIQRAVDAIQEEIDGRLYRQSNGLAYVASGASLLRGVSRDLPLPGSDLPHEELEPGGPGALPGFPPDTGIVPVTPGGPGPGDGLLGPPGLRPPANGLFPPLLPPAPAPAVPPGCPAPAPAAPPCPVNITVQPVIACPPLTLTVQQLVEQLVQQLPAGVGDVLLSILGGQADLLVTLKPQIDVSAPSGPGGDGGGLPAADPLTCPPGDYLQGLGALPTIRVAPFAVDPGPQVSVTSDPGRYQIDRASQHLFPVRDFVEAFCHPDWQDRLLERHLSDYFG